MRPSPPCPQGCSQQARPDPGPCLCAKTEQQSLWAGQCLRVPGAWLAPQSCSCRRPWGISRGAPGAPRRDANQHQHLTLGIRRGRGGGCRLLPLLPAVCLLHPQDQALGPHSAHYEASALCQAQGPCACAHAHKHTSHVGTRMHAQSHVSMCTYLHTH